MANKRTARVNSKVVTRKLVADELAKYGIQTLAEPKRDTINPRRPEFSGPAPYYDKCDHLVYSRQLRRSNGEFARTSRTVKVVDRTGWDTPCVRIAVEGIRQDGVPYFDDVHLLTPEMCDEMIDALQRAREILTKARPITRIYNRVVTQESHTVAPESTAPESTATESTEAPTAAQILLAALYGN